MSKGKDTVQVTRQSSIAQEILETYHSVKSQAQVIKRTTINHKWQQQAHELELELKFLKTTHNAMIFEMAKQYKEMQFLQLELNNKNELIKELSSNFVHLKNEFIYKPLQDNFAQMTKNIKHNNVKYISKKKQF